jgi:uncharacterized membrane protein
MFKWLKENFLLIGLFLFTLGVFAVTVKINIFRYENFDFGKFDLGNMTQMVWYTLQGKPMFLTDYFGTNLPRWAMSHVDPIILLFVPIYAIFPHALTLVFAQVILVLASSFIIYKIALLKLKSKLAAVMFGFAFVLYPAVGFLNAWTGFHGVTAAIPFFLAAFYVYEKMYEKREFNKKGLVLFWVLLVLTMMGKEQLPLYIIIYGLFIMLFRFVDPIVLPEKGQFWAWKRSLFSYLNIKVGLSMVVVGFLWFYMAFFVIIPKYAPLRVAGFQEFAQSLDVDTSVTRDVENSNYFITRYEAFGESYTDVLVGMAKDPKLLAKVTFGGDKPDNLNKTLAPLAYTSLLYPPIFVIALPDLLINYSTSAGGIGTAEIINHRISMIIPVLFLASIYGIGWLARTVRKLLGNKALKLTDRRLSVVFATVILIFSIYTTYSYNNPVFLWLTQAVQKRVKVPLVFAKTNLKIAGEDLELGERFKLSKLETKDRDCALKVVEMIPDNATVSGPDYLGAHLAQRETYAIFPALYNEADYVIVDVFSQKILRILELDLTLVRDVVADVIKSEDYRLRMGCGNLFVFERVGTHEKTELLPLQERFTFNEKTDLEIFQSLTVVDYLIPDVLKRGEPVEASFTYVKRENNSLDGYVLFLTFINEETGELYQVANLPSFSLNQTKNWREDRYYLEELVIALPEFLDPGSYKVFIGMSNEVRTRSIYLGDVAVE